MDDDIKKVKLKNKIRQFVIVTTLAIIAGYIIGKCVYG